MLPTYEQIKATSRDEAPFSNSDESGYWQEANCCRCLNDAALQAGRGKGCDLIFVAVVDSRTPMEWTETNPLGLSNRYRCAYFRSEDDGPDPEPKPIPDPPGQLTLMPREPYEQARMLTTYPEPSAVTR